MLLCCAGQLSHACIGCLRIGASHNVTHAVSIGTQALVATFFASTKESDVQHGQ